MKNKQKYLLIIIFLSLLLVGGMIFFFRLFSTAPRTDSLRKSPKRLASEVFLQAIPLLQKRWVQGAFDHNLPGELNCSGKLEFPKAGLKAFTECNPDYLECVLSGKTEIPKEFVVKLNSRKFQVFALPKFVENGRARSTEFVTPSSSGQDRVTFPSVSVFLAIKEIPGQTVQVLLEDHCHELYLPQRIYAEGKPNLETKAPGKLWDNFYRDIYIDKYMATWREIAAWLASTNSKETLEIPKEQKQFEPAIGLTFDQQWRYCAFLGKKVLSAHLYDAATYFSADQKENKARFIFRGPYPWGAWKELYDQNEEGPSRSNCRAIYSSECRERFPDIFPYLTLPSWMGVEQILGGVPEILVESFGRDELHVTTSSALQEFTSPLQVLGHRPLENGDQERAGFRCYRERFSEEERN